jgi:hypothetical protein
MENKRAELTTKQIVVMIVLVASFVVVLLLFSRLGLQDITDKEICHNSVVLMGQQKLTAGPLDCRTNYVCISGGGKCGDFSETSKVEVNPNRKDEIMNAIAEEMSDCWWMFGEGNIKYQKGLLASKVSCSICSIVVFDDKIQKNYPSISNRAFYDYLQATNKDNSQTYLQYLYGISTLPSTLNIKNAHYFGFSLSGDIDTSIKNSVLTGVDMNIPIPLVGDGKDRYINAFMIPTSQTPSTLCKEFITKA